MMGSQEDGLYHHGVHSLGNDPLACFYIKISHFKNKSNY